MRSGLGSHRACSRQSKHEKCAYIILLLDLLSPLILCLESEEGSVARSSMLPLILMCIKHLLIKDKLRLSSIHWCFSLVMSCNRIYIFIHFFMFTFAAERKLPCALVYGESFL